MCPEIAPQFLGISLGDVLFALCPVMSTIDMRLSQTLGKTSALRMTEDSLKLLREIICFTRDLWQDDAQEPPHRDRLRHRWRECRMGR